MVSVISSSIWADGNLSIALSVENNLSMNRVNEYVTSGIPIPKIYNVLLGNTLNIVDKLGNIIPSQIIVTARWGGSPNDMSKPIKWVLVTFPVDVNALETSQYFLKSGQNQTSSNLQIVSNTSDNLIVNTGNTIFALNKNNFKLFDVVTVDGLIVSSGGNIVLTDEQGSVFDSMHDTPKSFLIEEAGPLRIVIKIEGSLKSENGATQTDYTVYIYLFANQSYARVLYTLGNHHDALSYGCCSYDVFNFFGQNSITFQDLSVEMNLSSSDSAITYLFPSENENRTGLVNDLKIYQDSSGMTYWDRYDASDNPRPNSYVQMKGYSVRTGAEQIDAGNHFAGWLDITNSARGVLVGMVDFWQNCPKGFSAYQNGKIQLNIFPNDYLELYNFRVGEEKTTELFFYFHNGNMNTAQIADTAQALAHPMMATASADWYINSKTLQEFTPLDESLESRYGQINNPDDKVKYAYYNDRTLLVDPLYTGQDSDYYPFYSLWLSSGDKPSSVDYFDYYSWAWYGNQPLDFESYGDGKAGPFNVKYNFDFGAWIQFLRTKDLRWKDMAEAFTKHLELLMLHDVTAMTVKYGPTDVSRWKNAVFGMEQHNESGNTNTVRNTLGPVMDTAFGARGASLHYYLTGNPVSRRFLEKFADYAYNFFSDNPGIYESNDYLKDTRTFANFLTIMTEAFEYSGDLKYQQLAKKVMDYFAPEKQPWINGPVSDMTGYMQPMFFMQYLSAMARYAQAVDEFGLIQESSIAKQRVVSFIDWFLTYAVVKPYGWTSTWYMYYFNGDNSTVHDDGTLYDDMVNNWMLVFADACAYAYAFTLNPTYINFAKEFFRTGVNNPFYRNSPLTYASAKEAVNHAVNGHIYLYYQKFYDSLPPDNEAPTITITHPLSGTTLTGLVDLTVNVSDNVGIQKVVYLLNDQVLATVWSNPYNYSWNTVEKANGAYILKAKVYDYANNESVSQSISFNIENVKDEITPSCKILSPQENALLGGSFTVEAEAIDNVGIKKVEFYIDDKQVGAAVTQSPYTITVNSSQYADGTHLIYAKAYDTSNNIGDSLKVNVTIDNTNQVPKAVITRDTNQVYQIGKSITFDGAQSSDADGDILSYLWNFGDESPNQNGISVTHTYAAEGDYVVELTVSDGQFQSVVKSKITVYPNGELYTIILQEGSDYVGTQDALIRASYEGNYGGSTELQIYNGYSPDYRALLKFDLNSLALPENAIFVASQLELFCMTTDNSISNDIYRVKRSWVEGNGTYGNTFNGATWDTYDGINFWVTPGGELDLSTDFGLGPNGLVASVLPVQGRVTFDISSLVSKWLTGEFVNNGLSVLIPDGVYYSQTKYVSKEDDNKTEHPKLLISYLIPAEPPLDEIIPECQLISPARDSVFSGEITLSADAQDNIAVKEVQFYVNNSPVGNPIAQVPYSITINSINYASGVYTIQAKAIDTSDNVGESQIVNISIDHEIPVVAITSPQSNAVVSGIVNLTVNALDNIGIQKIIYELNGGELATISSLPYSYALDTTQQVGGTYILIAKAYDIVGNLATSTPVNITIDNEVPSVVITNPASNATVSGNINLSVDAHDNVGIQKVVYYLNGVEYGVVTTAPYSLALDTTQKSEGSYTLQAKVYDNAGNIKASDAIVFTIYQIKNLVLNPEADQNLQYWQISSGAKATVVTFNNDKVFATESGNVYQVIDLKNIPNINSGKLQIIISADMKAKLDNQDQGNPYLYGYLVGTQSNPKQITTYMQTNVVKSTNWQVQQASYTVPAYTNKVKIFLKRNQKNKAKTTNPTAYFDTITVKISEVK